MPVFLFPGQGSQFSGMGIDLIEHETADPAGIQHLYNLASEVYGEDVKNLLNSDEQTLKKTDKGQLAITLVSLAAYKALAHRNLHPKACAGFSLGEYPALAVAGVISEEECLRLVFARGNIMQEVCDAIVSSSADPSLVPAMSAIIGLSPEQVNSVLDSLAPAQVWGANYNSPLQTVISGTADALAQAELALKEAGARRCIRLKVAGPFHSPLMEKAGKQFAQVLQSVSFKDPTLPIFSNVTGKQMLTGDEAKKNAVLHISSPVFWTAEEAEIAQFIAKNRESDHADLIECGPGKVLTGLWSDSKHEGSCLPYSEFLQ